MPDIEIPPTLPRRLAQRRAARATRTKHRLKREAAYAEGRRTFDELAENPTFRDFVNLYIGEGYKRCRNRVAIGNSDPAVIAMVTVWMRRLARNPARFSVQHHADQDVEMLRRFWGELLDVRPADIRFQRKSNSGRLTSRSWRCRYGVLTVTANDTRLRALLQAWMDCVKEGWLTLGRLGA